MLFIIGALIGVVCFIIEILIGTTIPVIRRLARDHWLINISLSILLTWILTAMFGAAGLTVAFAAIVSLALSSVYYRIYWVIKKLRGKVVELNSWKKRKNEESNTGLT